MQLAYIYLHIYIKYVWICIHITLLHTPYLLHAIEMAISLKVLKVFKGQNTHVRAT